MLKLVRLISTKNELNEGYLKETAHLVILSLYFVTCQLTNAPLSN